MTENSHALDTCVLLFLLLLFYHNISPSGHVAGVVQGADLGEGLIFKVQLHILNAHVTPPWEWDSKKERTSIKPTVL